MKYETILKRVAGDVHAIIMRGGIVAIGGSKQYDAAVAAMFNAVAERVRFDDSLKALADRAADIILAWDVRMVGKLRELFPDQFPKSLQKGKLTADYDDDGDWAVFVLT